MNDRRRSQLAGGLVMVLLGAALLAVQLVPSLKHWIETSIDWSNSWALVVVGVGVFLLILGLLLGAPGMAVPACIVGGIGGLLYWQNATGRWETWAYAWALIPGLAGVGTPARRCGEADGSYSSAWSRSSSSPPSSADRKCSGGTGRS
jgi:hypothetical protein